MSTHSLRLALITGVVGFHPIAQSATFQVGNAAQLIAAIDTANGNGVNDTIILGADISLTAVNNTNILGVNGLPAVTADGGAGLDLEGNGHTISRAVGVDNFRILQVAAGASLSLHRVTLANGSSSNGGGIYNLGTLTLDLATLFWTPDFIKQPSGAQIPRVTGS